MDLDPGMVDFSFRFEHDCLWWTVTRPGQALDDASQLRRGSLHGSRMFEARSDTGRDGRFVYIRNEQCFLWIDPVEESHPSPDCSMLAFADSRNTTLKLEGRSLVPPDIRSERDKYRICSRPNLGFLPSLPLCRITSTKRDCEQNKVTRQFLGPLVMNLLRSGVPLSTDSLWMRHAYRVEQKSPEYIKGMTDAYAMLVGKKCLRVMTTENIPQQATQDPSVAAAAARIKPLYNKL